MGAGQEESSGVKFRTSPFSGHLHFSPSPCPALSPQSLITLGLGEYLLRGTWAWISGTERMSLSQSRVFNKEPFEGAPLPETASSWTP